MAALAWFQQPTLSSKEVRGRLRRAARDGTCRGDERSSRSRPPRARRPRSNNAPGRRNRIHQFAGLVGLPIRSADAPRVRDVRARAHPAAASGSRGARARAPPRGGLVTGQTQPVYKKTAKFAVFTFHSVFLPNIRKTPMTSV
jgi:hypothetical protein